MKKKNNVIIPSGDNLISGVFEASRKASHHGIDSDLHEARVEVNELIDRKLKEIADRYNLPEIYVSRMRKTLAKPFVDGDPVNPPNPDPMGFSDAMREMGQRQMRARSRNGKKTAMASDSRGEMRLRINKITEEIKNLRNKMDTLGRIGRALRENKLTLDSAKRDRQKLLDIQNSRGHSYFDITLRSNADENIRLYDWIISGLESGKLNFKSVSDEAKATNREIEDLRREYLDAFTSDDFIGDMTAELDELSQRLEKSRSMEEASEGDDEDGYWDFVEESESLHDHMQDIEDQITLANKASMMKDEIDPLMDAHESGTLDDRGKREFERIYNELSQLEREIMGSI
jgi:hypothetical protein